MTTLPPKRTSTPAIPVPLPSNYLTISLIPTRTSPSMNCELTRAASTPPSISLTPPAPPDDDGLLSERRDAFDLAALRRRGPAAARSRQVPQVPFFRRRIAGADLRVPPDGRDAEDGERTLRTRGSREGRTTWRWRGRRWGCTYSLGSDAGARGPGQI